MYQIYLLQESQLSVMQQLNQILSCEVDIVLMIFLSVMHLKRKAI